ncbi:hypothetical protein PV08_01091 [Exophiala spinifera]|uniref:Uncharacterized protein n=1 Tax=Exophiala spinifera TaxID=91928 RepID=A0A0D1YZ39_9EURO|nr:uncharacterized protein PV08_01091 [Exophiala spinifera]KIW20516.1 hypothetical protein PV08_01091 [Exophiala spinifera]
MRRRESTVSIPGGKQERLVETEYALYQALTPEEATGDKDSSSYDAFFSRFAGLPKTTRISEWDRWPLQTRGEREAWLQDRLASVTTPMNHGTTETTTVAPGLAGSSKTQPPSSARSPFDVDGSGVSETAGDVLQERQGHLTTLENSTGTDSWTWTGDLEFGPSPTAPTPQPFPTAPVVSPKKRKEPYTNSVTLGNSRYQASHAQQHGEAETGLDGGKWQKYF